MIRNGEVSPVEVTEAHLAADRGAGAASELVHHPAPREGHGVGPGGGAGDPGGELPGPAAWHPRGPEGPVPRKRSAQHCGLPHLPRLRSRHRLGGRGSVRGGRGGADGQAEPGPVRGGHRGTAQPGLRRHAQPLEHGPSGRGLQRRVGVGRCGGAVCLGHGDGHGGIDPGAGGPVRHRRVEAHLRPGEPPGDHRVLVGAGPRRTHGPHGGGHRPGHERPCRTRPPGPDLGRRARAGLHAGA